MIIDKFEPQRFFQQQDSVAALVPASELFGLLTRSVKLPLEFAALVSLTDGEKQVIAPGGQVESDDVRDVLVVRTTPLEMSTQAPGLRAADGFLCDANVDLKVNAVAERTDLESLREQLMGSKRVLRADEVKRYLADQIQDALAATVEKHDAGDLVDGKCDGQAEENLLDTLKGPCFKAGLVVSSNPVIRFESSAVAEVRAGQDRTARQMSMLVEREKLESAIDQARNRHLGKLRDLLNELKTLADDSPAATLPDLLRTFNESQRGRLYAALFESESPRPATQSLVVASGPELLFFDPASWEHPARRINLDGPVGPPRSIQHARTPEGELKLFVGAATGVYELTLEEAAPSTAYLTNSDQQIRGGFNSVTLLGDQVYASHSELGLFCWEAGRPDSGTRILDGLTRSAQNVRGIHAVDGRLVLSIDDFVASVAPDDLDAPIVYSGSNSTITAVLASPEGIFAGNSRGQILHWPAGRTDPPEILHHGPNRAAESLALLYSAGVPRLLYTDTSLAVYGRVLGDTFTCRYEAGGHTIRRVNAAEDLLVSTTDGRDRLLIWLPHKPELPSAMINVLRLTDHSIQDVDLIPLPEGP